jgi:AsmA protein
MNRWLKWILALVGVVVLVLAAAVIFLPRLIDNEDIKRSITEELARHTGREIRIDGPLGLSVFPVLAVEVNQLSLGNTEGFGDQPFASIGQARIGVGLLPLLRRQVRAEEIVLDRLQVNLVVNERGASNWGGLPSQPAERRPPPRDDRRAFATQYIAGLNISGASIDYRDDRAGSHYRLSDFSLQTGALGDEGPVPVEASMQLEDMAAGIQLDLSLTAEAGLDAEAAVYSLAEVELSLAIGEKPLLLKAPVLELDLGNDTLSVGSFSAEAGPLTATGALEAKRVSTAPSFTGTIEAGEFSPAAVIEALGLDATQTTDANVLGSMSFKSSFAGDPTRITLPDLNLRLDDSYIDGKLTLAALDTAQPSVKFSFDIDQIDIDRYLPPADGDAAGETQDVALPDDSLAGLDVEGAVRAERLTAMGVDFESAEAGLRIKNSVLRLHPLRAGFYGGQYVGDIVLDTTGQLPSVSLDQKVESIIFAQLARDLLGYDQVSGTAQGMLRATGSGATSQALLRDLDGRFELRLDEGALEGIDVWYEIRKALAQVKGQPLPEGDSGRTVFSRLLVDASIGGGRVQMDQLRGELPFLRLRGDGTIDLNTLEVDIGLVAGVRSSPELAKDPLAADLAGREVPFRITGPAAQPGISVDFEELLKSEATRALTDKLGELLGGKKDKDDKDGGN